MLAAAGGVQARNLPPTARRVAAARAAVSSCGALSGIGVSWTSTGGVVTALTLTSVPAACTGGALSVTLVGPGGSALGSAGPVTVTGSAMSLPAVTGSPTASAVLGVQLSVTGP